jgi:hypothetical protein
MTYIYIVRKSIIEGRYNLLLILRPKAKVKGESVDTYF